MFFSKPIPELTFEDVVNFASQGIKEGINLDYKRDFTADIEKTISAFANTHGGVVIIGINDQDGKPKIPVIGIDYVEGLHERVVQKCVEAIYPPIFPEIKVCDPVSNKTFVVIQVPESDQTPHAIVNRTKVYYRTDNITLLEDRANVERVQWLLNRREKSVDLRKTIIQDADRHFHDIWLYEAKKTPPTVATTTVKVVPNVTFTLIPFYPHKPLVSPESLKNDIGEWHARNKRDYDYPKYMEATVLPIQGGVRLFNKNTHNDYFFYHEINELGLLFCKENLIRTIEDDNNHSLDRGNYLFEDRLLGCIHAFLSSGKAFYQKYGYSGLIQFVIVFTFLEGVIYIPYGSNGYESVTIIHTPNAIESVMTVQELVDSKSLSLAITDIVLTTAWAFGIQSNKETIMKRLAEL